MPRTYSPRLNSLLAFACTTLWEIILGNLILIVDDDEADQFMLERTLRSIGVQNPIRRLSDAGSLIRYLQGDSPYNDRTMNPFPAVVFLDLKMRGIAGGDILNSVSALSTQDHAKIFVHSELGNVSELQRIYSLGADSFLSKPLKETDLFNLLYHFPAPFEIQPPSH